MSKSKSSTNEKPKAPPLNKPSHDPYLNQDESESEFTIVQDLFEETQQALTQSEMLNESLKTFRDQLKKIEVLTPPDFHVVLGSGFGAALDKMDSSWTLKGSFSFSQIPGLFSSSVSDHAGEFRVYKNTENNHTLLFQMGRLHGYEGHAPSVAIRPVFLSRLFGTQNFFLTNAAGGLDPRYKAGDAMIIKDHVNLTGKNPLIGPNMKNHEGKEIGPRFPDMGGLYPEKWRKILKKNLLKNQVNTHEGVYLGLMGPSFETHAEVQLYSSWGLQAVGMSTVWEAIFLQFSKATVGGLSLISNPGAGLTDQPLEHEAIVETCRASAGLILKSIVDSIENILNKVE